MKSCIFRTRGRRSGEPMYYPEETVQEVCAANDIVDVVGQVVRLKRKGASYFGLCPFHNEKTPSFSVSPGKQIFYCFGCGAGGDVVSFVMNYENMTFPEAVKSLADRVGYHLPEVSLSEEGRARKREKERILAVLKEAASFYYKLLRSPAGENGMEYLKKRGIGDNIMQSFGLGYAGKKSGVTAFLKERGYSDNEINAAGLVYMDEKRGMRDRFFNRVIFPIMDVNNHVIGFGGRVMGDGEPKYLNSPETVIFDKGKNLYGLNAARKSRRGYMIACEGYMDVISMHQAGFTEAVASLGTAFTPDHARILKRYTEDIRLAYDSDGAGVKAALRAIPILKSAGIATRVIDLKPCKDPDEFIKKFGRDEFSKRISEAEQSLSFEIHVMEKEYDLSDPEGRTRFQQNMARRLSLIDDEFERNNYTEAFAAEYMMDRDMLKRAVEQLRLVGDSTGLSRAPSEAQGSPPAKRKDDSTSSGMAESQKILLTLLGEEPDRVYKAVKQYLDPEDFSPGILETCAGLLYKQLDEGNPKISAIVNHFEDPEEQRKAAEIFSASLDPFLSNKDKENAVTDLVIKIKKDSLKRIAGETDEDPISRTLREKRVLEKLEKVRITLD